MRPGLIRSPLFTAAERAPQAGVCGCAGLLRSGRNGRTYLQNVTGTLFASSSFSPSVSDRWVDSLTV